MDTGHSERPPQQTPKERLAAFRQDRTHQMRAGTNRIQTALAEITDPANAKSADAAAEAGMDTGRNFAELMVTKAMGALGYSDKDVLAVLDRIDLERSTAEDIDKLTNPGE
jgi:hypothetical protein